MNKETRFKATFTLEQDGINGAVTPHLEYFPKVDDPREAPAIYGYMANELLRFLRMVHIIDGNNQVINPEYFDDVELNLTEEDHGETRQ